MNSVYRIEVVVWMNGVPCMYEWHTVYDYWCGGMDDWHMPYKIIDAVVWMNGIPSVSIDCMYVCMYV